MLKPPKKIATLTHGTASRKNIPTAEFEPVMDRADRGSIRAAYARRNRDLDPQLVWRGKDECDVSDLVVSAPPLFIQEKVHPKVLIDDLRRQSRSGQAPTAGDGAEVQTDLFADFNGLPDDDARTEFYQHDANWSNRMILGDSLQVMASLAEREGLRGKVQCIYLDPPYGIKFNSNFQWSTTSRDVQDGNASHITREPEQVKAFRDTWRDGIHSYLRYLRDRLVVARELLAESGSIFVQISDENVHLLRTLVDEVFRPQNAVATIVWKKGAPRSKTIKNAFNYILWYAKDADACKVRKMYRPRDVNEGSTEDPKKLALWGELPDGKTRPLTTDEKRAPWLVPEGTRVFRIQDLEGTGELFAVEIDGRSYFPRKGRRWRGNPEQFERLKFAGRISVTDKKGLGFRFFVVEDSPVIEFTNMWDDTAGNVPDMVYVVQTNAKIVSRCLLMTTDPGDLVLDPTCGSGTTASVAEQWGRRWITIDTSRVALALARARIMGARYPYYLLADSPQGQRKDAEITRKAPSDTPTGEDVRQGFVYERVPHITLKSIANNAEIDVIWERWQETLEPLRDALNATLHCDWQEWQIPRQASEVWPAEAVETHRLWWDARVARQQEIDASIAAGADYEYLYDKPYQDGRKVRVAGPFTVESVSPHRVLAVDEHDELLDHAAEPRPDGPQQDFAAVILEQLATAGVQQAHKEDRIAFAAVTSWPGEYICAEGRYLEGDGDFGPEKRAGIFVGPEFGTVTRPDLVAAAREAGDAGFDVLVACAFNYEAHASEFNHLGRIPVLKARMNADLHMAQELKNTGKGNLFVIFGEPDIDILPAGGDAADGGQLRVKIKGVDVFHPNTGEVRSDGADGIACWFIDTDYNEESFFVRHAYFLGANDPYKALKTTLKAEIDADAWESLHSDTSRSFDRPESGRIAVKVINHLGDEVMKVFRV